MQWSCFHHTHYWQRRKDDLCFDGTNTTALSTTQLVGWFYIFRGGVLFYFVPQESHGQAGSSGGNRFWTLSHLFDSGRKDVAPESVRQNQWGGSQLATLASTPSEPSWEMPQWEESLEKCGYLDCTSPYMYCNQKWKFTEQNGVLTQDSWGHRCTPQCCIVQCSVLEHCASPEF